MSMDLAKKTFSTQPDYLIKTRSHSIKGRGVSQNLIYNVGNTSISTVYRNT